MDILDLSITDLSRGGAGVAKSTDGRIVFVPFTAPGDRVRAKITETKKNYLHAELLELIEPSPKRVKPRCPVFQKCGGCQWQHIPYALQWETKKSGAIHALTRVGIQISQSWDEFPAESPWEYRNRIQLRGDGERLGFYAKGSHDVVFIQRCDIARPELNQHWPVLKEKGKTFKRPYKVEVEVHKNSVVSALWNQKHAAGGFRQVNDEQNQKLKNWIATHLKTRGVVLDLFGGSGNLSLDLSQSFENVYCVDTVIGKNNENDPNNFHHIRQDTLGWLKSGAISKAHAAIIDPPREGLGPSLTEIAELLQKLGTTEVIAIGCHVDSWARDLSRWIKKGWNISELALFDFFPQTPHVEAACRITRANDS